MDNLTNYDLNSFIKKDLSKDLKRLRGKYPAISEVVNKVSKALSIKKIYDMSNRDKYCYLFIIRNYSKQPKLRYFLGISLAHNSSDFLVQLARDFALQSDLNLVQYSIYPKILRIQLLLLKEIRKVGDFDPSIKLLKDYRKIFRGKLTKIKNLVENE
jgi:hypothetical protein